MEVVTLYRPFSTYLLDILALVQRETLDGPQIPRSMQIGMNIQADVLRVALILETPDIAARLQEALVAAGYEAKVHETEVIVFVRRERVKEGAHATS